MKEDSRPVNRRYGSARILIYSHDSFGLGHLRRCRAIAHALVENFRGLSVLILSGSPIIGSFDFRARVDFIRIPGVIKLRSGDYVSLRKHISIDRTLAMRESIIYQTASSYSPDVFIVDKEPAGLQGEILSSLRFLKASGTGTVLGLRDILDAPDRLQKEWDRKNVWPVLAELYDEIWAYGVPAMGNPLADLKQCPASALEKLFYTGYLWRGLTSSAPAPENQKNPEDNGEDRGGEPRPIVVTTGGGGDGQELTEAVIAACERGPLPRNPVTIVLGPFMPSSLRLKMHRRVRRLDGVTTLVFDNYLERRLAQAAAIVAMGGYNTFCEILSFDKPALIVPRTEPRMEQFLRAERAQKLGLVSMLPIQDARDPDLLLSWLARLPALPLPSSRMPPGLLNGLEALCDRVRPYLQR